MFVIRGRLAPEVGALLVRALTAARETLYQRTRHQPAIEDRPSMAQQQADALAAVAETALHHGVEPGAAAEHYQVVVHVDAPVLADPANDGNSALEDGMKISAETSRRLACDATRVVMQHGRDGRVVEVAARTRTIPPATRRALHHRDPGCRFPGCAVRFGQAHHIRHWAEGGPTTLSNLAVLCRRHHRAVHEEGFHLERLPNGELRFRRPNGSLLPDAPQPPRVPDDPSGALRAQDDAQGLRLTSRSLKPLWLGERIDVGWAVGVLHPRANPRSTGRSRDCTGDSTPTA